MNISSLRTKGAKNIGSSIEQYQLYTGWGGLQSKFCYKIADGGIGTPQWKKGAGNHILNRFQEVSGIEPN